MPRACNRTKVTVPVGVPVAGATGDTTVTKKTTSSPHWLIAGDDVSVVVVAVCACAAPSDNSNVAQTNAAAPIARSARAQAAGPT